MVTMPAHQIHMRTEQQGSESFLGLIYFFLNRIVQYNKAVPLFIRYVLLFISEKKVNKTLIGTAIKFSCFFRGNKIFSDYFKIGRGNLSFPRPHIYTQREKRG